MVSLSIHSNMINKWTFTIFINENPLNVLKLEHISSSRKNVSPENLLFLVWVHLVHSSKYTLIANTKLNQIWFCAGNFSRLTVHFRFERQIGHHLIQTFAPSTLVVMLSWFSFWLGLDAIPGRVTLLVTCMLTLVTMFTGLRADIPPVAYVKVNIFRSKSH